MNNHRPPTLNQLRWAISQTKSMTQASLLLKYSYNTFRKYCKMYGIWEPNQCGKGIRKPKNKMKNQQSDPTLFWRDEDDKKRSIDRIKNIFS